MIGTRRTRSVEALHYRDEPRAPGATPWRQAAYCVVDLELTGLDPREDSIISFGAVPVDGGRVIVRDSRAGLCRPSSPLKVDSIVIHGLRGMDLADAPGPAVALRPLLDAMAGRILVAHSSWVEQSFLQRAFRPLGVRLRGPIIDTVQLGAALGARLGRPLGEDLAELVANLGLPAHREHDALGDALTTAQVFIALATLLDRETPQTVATLAGDGRRAALSPARAARRSSVG